MYIFYFSAPENLLREFITNEVLSKYTTLFEQPAENTAQDGTPIQPWIQKILGEMQKNIDHHINTAILEASASK